MHRMDIMTGIGEVRHTKRLKRLQGAIPYHPFRPTLAPSTSYCTVLQGFLFVHARREK
jgi:hypothetical protein